MPPEREHERLETNIGLTLINRIGVITLVLGVGFFFKWAVNNQYIGPAGRVELGILAGLLTLFAADFVWNRGQKIFAQGVTGTAVCILYLSIYAAFGFYHLVPQTFAFLLMVVVTLMAAALALRYDAVAIAALGMFGGYLTPILLSSGVDHPWFLFTYILLLDLGALALSRVRPWALLNILSFIATALLYAGWLSDRFTTAKQTVATIFDLVYYVFFSYALSLPAILFAQVLASIAMVAIWPRDPAEYFLSSLLIALGGLALADIRKAAPLVATTFASTWICFAMWNAEFTITRPLGPVLIGLTCTFAIFLAWILWWTVWRRQPARAPELVILALNGIAYFGASYGLLNPEYHAWLGLFAVAVAGIHLGLAFLIWKNEGAGRPQRRRSFAGLRADLHHARDSHSVHRLSHHHGVGHRSCRADVDWKAPETGADALGSPGRFLAGRNPVDHAGRLDAPESRNVQRALEQQFSDVLRFRRSALDRGLLGTRAPHRGHLLHLRACRDARRSDDGSPRRRPSAIASR